MIALQDGLNWLEPSWIFEGLIKNLAFLIARVDLLARDQEILTENRKNLQE